MITVYMDKNKVEESEVKYTQRGVFMVFNVESGVLQIRNASNKTIAVYSTDGYLRAEDTNG